MEISSDHATATPPPTLNAMPDGFRRLLLLESLFTVVGGYTDAYAFLAHGHTFANAQTGNVVLFAVFAAQKQWMEAARHVPPILACIAGVASARLLGAKAEKKTFHATLVCLSIEILLIAFLCVFGARMPDGTVVPTLSFVAALQITSFDSLGSWSFNSAMTTGNLKSATEAMVLWLRGRADTQTRGKAITAGLACLCFVVGALLGALYTQAHPRFALVPCVGLLAAAWLSMLRFTSKAH